MKYFLFFILFCPGQVLAQKNIYDQSVQTTKGNTISLSAYKGKKLLIAVVSAASLQQKNAINYWDSLKVTNPDVVIIVIPANDVTTNVDTTKTDSLQASSDKVTVTTIASAKKDNGSNQDPLLQWLTHRNKNAHLMPMWKRIINCTS
jgi:glutathione peroxidase-family protein